jgi:phosphotransferase system enzyme I (PtsP)
VAAIAGADVVSVYVREHENGDNDQAGGEQVFVMRGNVGFPAESVGRVRLRVGEGITGFVADRLLPVSVAAADQDEHFKYIPGLGEERFPALLAVPVVRAGAATAVLVLQRGRDRAFTSEEVVLATALAAVINHALERAHEREQVRPSDAHATVRLTGVGPAPGVAMGRAAVLPTLAALAHSARSGDEGPAVTVEVALERLRADLRRLTQASSGAAARELASLGLILDDERFRQRLAQAAVAPVPLKRMSELAREYARAAFTASGADAASLDLLSERAAEIEDLCVIVHAAISGRPLLRAGDIVICERLRTFLALYASARGVSAFVSDGPVADDSVSASLARQAGVPLLAAVGGVFAWVRPGDLLVVDADAGALRVNPEATHVARFRHGRAG